MRWIAVLLLLSGLAQAEDEYRLLKFGATWCGPCHTLDKTMEHADFKTALKKHNVIVHTIDIDQDKIGASNWKIEAVPTCILVRMDGHGKAVVLRRRKSLMDLMEAIEFVKPPVPKAEPAKPVTTGQD